MTLKIAINAQLSSTGISGGVTQFVIGLVHGLGQLEDGNEEYIAITSAIDPDWLNPYLGPNTKVAHRSPRHWREAIRKRLGPWRDPLDRFLEKHRRRKRAWHVQAVVPESDGFIESLGVDMIHYPTQQYTRCAVPALYNPHDLQHLHYPEYFGPEVCKAREVVYRAACEEAVAVVPEAECTRQDIIRHYGIDPGKIHVVYAGSPTEAYAPLDPAVVARTARKYALPDRFCLYPADLLAHKNHIRLLEGLARWRDVHDSPLALICAGRKTDHWAAVDAAARSLGLSGDRVRFLGYVGAPAEMRSLYSLARFVIFPSLFEGAGLPVMEAFHEGTPVACARATALPEYAGDGALLFDPESPEAIAEALERMDGDADLRQRLRRLGAERVQSLTWKNAARQFREIYRSIGPFARQDRAQ